MFQFFANIFGYVLNFIYNLVQNYGLAMILFTLVIKLLMLPLSIKQQRTMKKSAKLNEQMRVLQFKYKNDPEKLNQEMMKLYKEENMSPFSGCLGTILQFILLISIFYMVRCPLTYMKKVDTNKINNYVTQLQESEKTVSAAYPEIDLIREVEFLEEKNPDDEELKKIDINMNFLGLDLSKIPQQNLADWTVYIIPVLYIISTFVSMRITTSMQKKAKIAQKEAKEANKVEKNVKVENGNENESTEMVKKEEEEYDVMEQTNKMMSWMMPVMSVSISLVAPLGLALYWLVNNIAMIGERLILNKVIKDD
jgi:YidC/Oxa1 family membrane protein insertase